MEGRGGPNARRCTPLTNRMNSSKAYAPTIQLGYQIKHFLMGAEHRDLAEIRLLTTSSSPRKLPILPRVQQPPFQLLQPVSKPFEGSDYEVEQIKLFAHV